MLASLTPQEQVEFLFEWRRWARPNQLPPTIAWRFWVICTGRGWGKTRSAAEWVRAEVEAGRAGRVALVAPIAADARDVMVEGESGMLAVCPPWNRPHYEPSKRRLTWPNGAIATTYAAFEPDNLRGPQHDLAWADEFAAWRYPQAWDMLLFGLRLGADPRVAVTLTPKPLPHVKALLENPFAAVVRGSSYENRANLAPAFFTDIVARYEGTRLGRQELYGEVLEEAMGALWTGVLLDRCRVTAMPEMRRIVVGVDPASGPGETGIVVAGLGADGQGYVLDDATIAATPGQWAAAVVAAYHRHKANAVVAESNQGGAMVEHTLRTVEAAIPIKMVTASRGKQARAEPVAALYEQGRVHHVGFFGALESQMRTWVPGEGMPSPDRMDALVWALTELMVERHPEVSVRWV